MQALGTGSEDMSLSRSTIQQAQASAHGVISAAQKEAFSYSVPLLLHWDGKLLPDIAGGFELVAILVTGGQTGQLLAVPKISRGTGKEQSRACIQTLDDWQLKALVHGLVFDTTASNTGLNLGACTLIEKAV